MSTLEEAPIAQTLDAASLVAADSTDETKLSRKDLIYVFDVSKRVPKAITVADLAKALGITLT